MTRLSPRRFASVTSASLLAAVSFAGAGTSPQYTLVDLGPAPGIYTYSSAAAINIHGEAAGVSSNGLDKSTTLWLPEPAYGLPPGTNALNDNGRAYGLNDHGQTVGFVDPADGGGGFARAYIWDPVKGQTILPPFGGTHGIANAVNNNGWVVGESDTATSQFRAAFLWDGTDMIDLGTFEPGAFQSRAQDINDLNQVVGLSMYANPEQPDNGRLRAMLWLPEPAYGLPAGMNDLDTLSELDRQFTEARAINNRGQVMIWGSNELNSAQFYAAFWLWLPEADYGLPAGLNDLSGPFGIDSTAFSQDINERGEAVFRANVDPSNPWGDYRAMVWRQGEWFDLIETIPLVDQLAWVFGSATSINDSGEIVGWGFKLGEQRGFKLIPVLEDDCPSDLDGDREVGFDDLLLVLSLWGEQVDEIDLDDSGVVDFGDLLIVLSDWGPCDVDGACCFDFTGDCQTLAEVDCDFMGGAWTPNVTCATLTCPQPPTGACCFLPDGACTLRNEFHCGLDGGAWSGAGTRCTTVMCPTAVQGDWIGDPFPIPGLPFSTTGNTSNFTDDYDEQCDFHSDERDVVYRYTPTSDDIVNISTCAGSAFDTKLYVWENTEGNVVACDDATCESPQFPFPGLARIESLPLSAGQTYYIVVDGSFQPALPTEGPYTLDIESVMPGACCLPDETCTDISIDLCDSFAGTWFAGDCATVICPTLPRGACCVGGGVCVANQLEFDCINDLQGEWQGPDTSCFGATCP